LALCHISLLHQLKSVDSSSLLDYSILKPSSNKHTGLHINTHQHKQEENHKQQQTQTFLPKINSSNKTRVSNRELAKATGKKEGTLTSSQHN
jgi:hypothetical protein